MEVIVGGDYKRGDHGCRVVLCEGENGFRAGRRK